jgi:hypothetical protein
MHPMQDYFWKVFHKYYNLICIFICTPICTKIFILAKSGCYMVGGGDLVQRNGDGHTGRVVGDQAIERSGNVVCGLYRAQRDEERGFFGLASKPRSTVC